MKLSELLVAIDKVASDKGLSKPFIVGGLVRDKLLNRIDTINDVDITTGDSGIHFLAREIAERLKDHNNFNYDVMSDGHSRITIDNFKLDFSSNFKAPGIEAMLERVGISDPSEMQKELYSRDFTCNAALMTLDFSKIVDPTGLAVQDIEDKVIKTLLPPKLTLGYDNNRIVRVIYMAAKLGFEVDSEIKDWIKEHAELITNSKPDYISKKLKKAAEYNSDITAEILSELGLWKYIPLVPDLIEYQKADLISSASKKKKKKKKKKENKRVDLDVRPNPNPFFKNFDYGGPEGGSDVSPGTGLYHGKMDKYKSTKDFIEKSRKRKHRKKALKLIFKDIKKKADHDIEQRIQDLGAKNPRPFNSWFNGKDRVYIPFNIKSEDNENIRELSDDVIRVLKETYPDKCKEIDFVNGHCSGSGQNKYKIGKLLTSARNKQLKEIDNKIKDIKNSETFSEYDPAYIELVRERDKTESFWLDIINAFTNSPIRIRKNTKDVGHYVVVSQNPKDIAYMSTYRNWESCMTLPLGEHGPGQYHEDVFCEIEEGGLIAYLIRDDDKDIQDPIARIRIRRFENINGDSYAIPEKSVYGDDVPGFAEVVKSWIEEHQGSAAAPGLYKMRGGSYSDTFSTSLVVAPDDEKSLIAWISQPEKEEHAIMKYWVVVDNLRLEEDDLFDEGGLLEGFADDAPTEKIFYDESEAYKYSEIMENSESNYYIYETLERECEEEFRYQNGPGATGDKRLSSSEMDAAIEQREHLKWCKYSRFIDATNRFEVLEREDDRTGIMRRAVADKLLDNPGVYTTTLVELVKDYLFKSQKHERKLQKKFVEQYSDEYPELIGVLSEERSIDNINMLINFYKSLREGGEKDNLGNMLKSEVEDAYEQMLSKEPIRQDITNLYSKMNILEAFKPIPADLAQKSIDFANKLLIKDVPNYDKKGTINHLLHLFAMTKTDIPAVQNFYKELLPNLNVMGRSMHRSREDKVEYGLDEFGFALARLGENGKQFIPFLKQKIEEVRNWKPTSPEDLGYIPPFDEYYKTVMSRPYGNKTPENIRNEYANLEKRSNDNVRYNKLFRIEQLLYIIDAIENGTGHSSKYNFFREKFNLF